MRPKLIKVRAGEYRFGPFTVRGSMVRGDGRQASRITTWLVYRDGHYIEQYATLWVATDSLTRRLHHADVESRSLA